MSDSSHPDKSDISDRPVAHSEGWRAVAAIDRSKRQELDQEQENSTSLLRLKAIREAVEASGWRGAQNLNDYEENTEQSGWRTFKLSDANIEERERERREKMRQRAEKRAEKSKAARDSWSQRTVAKERRSRVRQTRSPKPSTVKAPERLDAYQEMLDVTEGVVQRRAQSAEGREDIGQNETSSKSKKSKRERPPINGEWLKNAGLRYLARFNASEKHFRDILKNKIRRADSRQTEDRSIHQSWIEDAVRFAKEYGGLDDERFARGLAKSLKRRGLARGAARLKMRQKQLGADQIETALAESYTATTSDEVDPNLYAAARAAKKKRLGPWGPHDVDYPTLQKQLAKLARRGFSYSIAQRILKASLEEAESWLSEGDR